MLLLFIYHDIYIIYLLIYLFLGSLDAEAGIYAMAFDLSGSRLLTCEADKSIKIWRENLESSEESHPIDMKTWTKQCLQLKRF